MRVCYVLLAAAATLLASCETAAAKTTSELSKLAAADAVQPVDAAMMDNRFLRSYQDLDEEDDDEEDEDEAAEEERGRPLFDTKKLEKALNNYEYSQKLFKRWKKNDYTDVKAAEKLGVNVNGGFDQTYSNLYMSYRAYLRDH